MKAKGIRVNDKKNSVILIELPDILSEINNGNLFHWSILFLDASGHLGEGRSIPEFEKQIDESEKGFYIDWNELNTLSKNFHQIIDVTLIGCKDESLLHRYEKDQEMYETCDIIIVMFDSQYWEVFSKDLNLIDRLAAKFKEVEFLETNFQDK